MAKDLAPLLCIHRRGLDELLALELLKVAAGHTVAANHFETALFRVVRRYCPHFLHTSASPRAKRECCEPRSGAERRATFTALCCPGGLYVPLACWVALLRNLRFGIAWSTATALR